MPLDGYKSLCNSNASQIVSRDKGSPRYHKGVNKESSAVTHYKIDGIVIQTGIRCDFLLINEDKKIAYLIELKGSDLVKAAQQLETTARVLQRELSTYSLQYRIIANKCKTQEIRTAAYRKYQIRWGKNLQQNTGKIEENI